MTQKKTYSILVVEDEEQVAKIIAKYLSYYKGFNRNIVIAKDGVEAMQKISNQDFDLIITDLVMPRRSGMSFVDNLRKVPKYYYIKIMVISGCLSRDICMKLMQKGIRQILVKPFTIRQLLERTFEVLKIAHPLDEIDLIIQHIAQREISTMNDDLNSPSSSILDYLVFDPKETEKDEVEK